MHGCLTHMKCDQLTMDRSDTDHLFSALAHQRRRYALACLTRHHVLTLADLADELAVREHGMTIDGIPADAVTDIYLSLYHCHVPKLADANVVEYDQDQDLVSITADGKVAHAWLEEEMYDFSEQPPRARHTCADES